MILTVINLASKYLPQSLNKEYIVLNKQAQHRVAMDCRMQCIIPNV